MARVYYIGDWSVMAGPIFAGTAFNYSYKGLDIFNYGKWLKAALESSGRHAVESVAAWDFYNMGPGEYEKIIARHDAFVVSDVEAKTFQLAPSFFDRSKFGKKPLTFPDRVRLTVDAVRRGKGIFFLGGWLSFSGEQGKGGWNRTPFNEILPVDCMTTEDLVESTEGFYAEATEEGRAFFKGVDFKTMPPILGYNRVEAKPEAQVLLKIRGSGDPLLVVGQAGKGKTVSYMSDPAPHWGCNFVYWKRYNAFWLRLLAYALG
jgi:uncharacterized membrane protein